MSSLFFGLWKHKKNDLKSLFLWQFAFFFLCSPNCPQKPRIEYLFYKFLYPMIFGPISGAGLYFQAFDAEGRYYDRLEL